MADTGVISICRIKKSFFQQMSDYNVFCCLVTFKPYVYLIRAVCRRNVYKCLLSVPFGYKKALYTAFKICYNDFRLKIIFNLL